MYKWCQLHVQHFVIKMWNIKKTKWGFKYLTIISCKFYTKDVTNDNVFNYNDVFYFQFSNMVADFVITGPEFRARGPGGYLCTGFWDNDWTYNPLLSSC